MNRSLGPVVTLERSIYKCTNESCQDYLVPVETFHYGGSLMCQTCESVITDITAIPADTPPQQTEVEMS